MTTEGGFLEYPILPYEDWPASARQRELEAQHTFGMHLFEHVRDRARRELLPGLDEDQKRVATGAIDETIGFFLAFLDGVPMTRVGEKAVAEYVLKTSFQHADASDGETFEIAPGGDGLSMGFAGWRRGDFGQSRPGRRGDGGPTMR